MRIVQFIAFIGTLDGLLRIVQADGKKGSYILPSIILFGSVVIGLVASILVICYRARMHDIAPQQKIALDVLEKIGKQKR